MKKEDLRLVGVGDKRTQKYYEGYFHGIFQGSYHDGKSFIYAVIEKTDGTLIKENYPIGTVKFLDR